MAKPRPSRSDARRMNTRERLLEGVRAAVVEHGLRDVTMDHILASSSFSRRTFYLHFPSKEEALSTLYEQKVWELIAAVDGAIHDTPDPAQRLFAEIDAYLDFEQKGGKLVAQLQIEAASPASFLYPARDRMMTLLLELIDADVREQLGHALDPLVYRCLMAGFEELVIYSREDGVLTDASRERVSKIMKYMFLNVLGSAAEMPHAEE
jgi:AcrR family transcriptional regulator